MNSFRPAPPSPAQQSYSQHQQPQQPQQFSNSQNPHAQQQNYAAAAAMNGMNGGNVAGAMAGMPTPAGHQMELNYIYNMVEELSRQLAENRRQTEQIVEGIGRVRNRARQQQLGNEELINVASDEINSTPFPFLLLTLPPLLIHHPIFRILDLGSGKEVQTKLMT